MEKPNITDGKWRIGNYRPYRQVVQIVDPSKDNDARPGKRQICKVNDNGEQKENAQAISAVPEMLDALMKARESHIEHVTEMPEPPREDEVLESIDNALIKAGCSRE